jgi:membrane protein
MGVVQRARSVGETVHTWLERHPLFARHLAAFRRANALRFTRWAAGTALFGYLSLFPLAVLATVAFSTLLSSFPEARAAAEQALTDALSVNGLLSSEATVDIDEVASATASAGVVGVVGLLVAGLGWVDATLEGVRRMLGAMRRPRSGLLLRLEDAVWLLALGSVLLVALMAAVGVRSAGTWVLEQVGWELGTSWVVRTSGDVLALLLVWLVIGAIYAFAWSRPRRSWRGVITGSLLAVLGMGVLTRLAFLLVGRTLTNPVYGTLAVAAALLLLLYFASVIIMYCACWVAVVEGAPEPSEERAYYERMNAGDVALPLAEPSFTEEAGPPDAVDG